MLEAIKVRLYPNAEQEKALAFQFGAVRWVCNFALEWRRKAWTETGERVTRRMTLDRLVELKAAEETKWLGDADSQALRQAMIHLDDAFGRFFGKRGRHPRFKNRHGRQSMSCPQRVKVVDGCSLHLPKVGTVRAVLHRETAGGSRRSWYRAPGRASPTPRSWSMTGSLSRSRRHRLMRTGWLGWTWG